MKRTSRARFCIVCLHAGREPDPSIRAIITPATRRLIGETPANPLVRPTGVRDFARAIDRA